MKEKRILCFGDSLTWGYDPTDCTRFPKEKRWPGVLQALLGDTYEVIEEGQNGRTISVDDPTDGEKSGIRYVLPCIESHSPLEIMIIMLGTNDLKKKYGFIPKDIERAMRGFLEKVQTYNHYRLNDSVKILLIAPPITGQKEKVEKLGELYEFSEAEKVSKEIPERYKALAGTYNCAFLDSSCIIETSSIDGVHLEEKEQEKLGRAVYEKLVREKYIV